MSSLLSKIYANMSYDLRSYGTEQVSRIASTSTSEETSGINTSPVTPGLDSVDISPEARAKAKAAQRQENDTGLDGLTQDQRDEVSQLKTVDDRVRAHEQAHIAAGGSLIRGGVHYQYEKGPDGKQYAVGGEVQIDTNPVKDDPEATLRKADRIRSAALAPADPSSQDRSVAASATQMASQARAELNQKNTQNTGTNSSQIRHINITA